MTDVHCHPQKTRSKFLPEMTTTQALNIDQVFCHFIIPVHFFWWGGGYKMLTMAAQEKERNTCAWSVKGKGNKWMDDEESLSC